MNASRLVTLIPDALDLPPAERTAFLDRECRLPTGEMDYTLRAEAEALLASAMEVLDGDLRSPVDGLVGGLADDENMAASAPPETVGPWRVTGLLGEGGQGVVYRASRADGAFEREVALKVLRPGVDGVGRLAARLEEERRVLAHLEHEGIARLYDGGLADDGRPYLAMELVRGRPITEAAHNLSVRQRVALLATVADAVAFAHARLVVHRDLKPSNVLVTEDGRPKLLDFGVAKLLGHETDPALTVPGWMTPAYAAPEQVQNGEITTATDVYALGVLAYEVLAGERPYSTAGLTPAEAERVIAETTPQPPSATAPPARRPALRGDLDTIVLKALEKEPSRRYASAEAFAADLRRHLDGLPVEARPATVGYRVGRFVRRHRAGVIGTLAGLAVIVGVAGAAFARVASERDQAETSRAQAEETLTFLESAFGLGNPAETDGEITMAAALDSVAAQVDTVEDPTVASSLHLTLANAHLGRGSMDLAERHARLALGLAESRSVNAGLAHYALSYALESQGELETALAHSDTSVAVLRERLGVENVQENYSVSLSQRGIILNALGRFEEATRALSESASLADPGSDRYFTTLANLAVGYAQQGEYRRAADTHGRIVEAFREMGQGSGYEVAVTLGNQASALGELGPEHAEDALRLHTEGLTMSADILGDSHPATLRARITRAGHLASMGRDDEARRESDQALALSLAAFGPEDFTTAYAQAWGGRIACENGGDPARGLALSRASKETRSAMVPPGHWLLSNMDSVIGGCLWRMGERNEAEALLRQSYTALEEALGGDHARTQEARERLAIIARTSS